MPSPWIIRPAAPADYARILAMNHAIQQYERDLVGYPVLRPEEVSDGYFADLVAHVEDDDGAILVAEGAGELIGFAAGYQSTDDDMLVDADFNRHALLSDIYVVDGFRGRGVAQALMTEFADIMRAKGALWLRICAKAQNQAAIGAYLQFGFAPYETTFTKRL
jgi:ribosomal protein S18 acetylase RimI-like enzyme